MSDDHDAAWLRTVFSDPWYRLTSGSLYKIKIKARAINDAADDGSDEGNQSPLASLAQVDDEYGSTLREGAGEGGRQKPGSDSFDEFFTHQTEKFFDSSQKIQRDFIVPTNGQILLPDAPSDEEIQVVPFLPNPEQMTLMKKLWTRNVITKARQLGFTSLVSIMWLDHALFNGRQKCGMIAHTKDAAEEIFRDKVLLAYEQLPPTLKERMPLSRKSASALEFAHNGSVMVVTTSGRSGTFDRLHISEFGKVSARDPRKAAEIVTGSLPAVPADGIVIVESTAEGTDGEYYRMVDLASKLAISGKKLNKKQFRMHFFPWWINPEYSLEDAQYAIAPEDDEYFAQVEQIVSENGYELHLTRGQKVWYLTTRDDEFGGDEQKMWQEMPSYLAEAFKVSVKGAYYARQLSQANKQRRVGLYPYVPGIQVNTFWDIGNSDGTGVWLHQKVGGENRFVRYIEGWEEHYSHYTSQLTEWARQHDATFGTHFLPHDAEHKRQLATRITCPLDELKATRLQGKWAIVPKVDQLMHGIQKMRQAFPSCTFDAAGCKLGLEHLWNYRKTWNRKSQTWSNTPDKTGGHSEAADAIRQFAQAEIALTSATGLSRESLSRFKKRDRRR